MADDSENKVKLLQKYDLTGDLDEITLSWKKMLDLGETRKSNVDWYSTKTFEAFLDALDINQPTPLHDKSKRGSTKSTLDKNLVIPIEKIAIPDDKIHDSHTSPEKPKEEIKKEKKTFGVETILSAEALKILSELPNLSHMPGTRSFMFPRSNKKSR